MKNKMWNRKKNADFILIFSLLILFLAAFFLVSLCVGAEKISISQTFRCFFDYIFGNGNVAGEMESGNDSLKFKRIIVCELRLPRNLIVVLTGILLGGSGAVFQMFFRNPLAEPALMGISSGATLGAVITQTLGIVLPFAYLSSLSAGAFIGALFSGLIVTILAFSNSRGNATVMLLLCGTALGTLYAAISSLLLITNSKELINIYGWMAGSFNGRGWNELRFILIPAAISILLMILLTSKLDYLNGGEKSARALGLNIEKIRIMVLVCGALAVSASVCAGGTIGFIGLMAPHIVRKLTGPKANRVVPLSMICGAILLLISDTLARILIAPAEIPAGIITSILGVPFFLSIILGKRMR